MPTAYLHGEDLIVETVAFRRPYIGNSLRETCYNLPKICSSRSLTNLSSGSRCGIADACAIPTAINSTHFRAPWVLGLGSPARVRNKKGSKSICCCVKPAGRITRSTTLALASPSKVNPLGQTLIVTAGCGWVQREGGPIEETWPGDVVWFPPARSTGTGPHQLRPGRTSPFKEKFDGKVVDWMEQVSDEQYCKGVVRGADPVAALAVVNLGLRYVEWKIERKRRE